MEMLMRLETGQEYAVVYRDAPATPLRPLKAVWNGEKLEVHDPDDPLDFPTAVPSAEVKVLGGWTDRVHPVAGRTGTWQAFAELQYRHVLRQRELAVRLAEVGIKRDLEPYTHRDRISNAVELGLTLNYEELDLLLRRGGV